MPQIETRNSLQDGRGEQHVKILGASGTAHSLRLSEYNEVRRRYEKMGETRESGYCHRPKGSARNGTNSHKRRLSPAGATAALCKVFFAHRLERETLRKHWTWDAAAVDGMCLLPLSSKELVAADASPEALEVAKRNVRGPNVTFLECTPDTLPFPNDHFDFIFSLGVLHHLPDTQSGYK